MVTVENLTTFHDCTDSRDLYIYLGGFHNRSKEKLLEMIYAQNPDKVYFHKFSAWILVTEGELA